MHVYTICAFATDHGTYFTFCDAVSPLYVSYTFESTCNDFGQEIARVMARGRGNRKCSMSLSLLESTY